MLAQILAHRVFLKADVFAQFDVRQSLISSRAGVLVNPRFGNFEQRRKLINCEQSLKIGVRQSGDHSGGDILRVCAHEFYGNAETGSSSGRGRNISFASSRRLCNVVSTGETHMF